MATYILPIVISSFIYFSMKKEYKFKENIITGRKKKNEPES